MALVETNMVHRCIPVLLLMLVTGGTALGQVGTDAGLVEGSTAPGSSVRAFKGIPYAAPPVGALRWQPPRPVSPWPGVRKATEFGHRCMQLPVFPDMVFRDEQSEDCLHLNVWAPASGTDRLPVMVWIYGGGFQSGSSSEPRQDGERLAAKGVVVVSFNYRVGLFGFLSHPELTKESPHRASGNYGLLDQVAALQWVRRNITAFGGNPENVTIFGESAGSFSVSALMASPLAKDLFHKAIGESGAFFTAGAQTLVTPTLAASEQSGAAFATAVGAPTLAMLRAKPAEELLKAASGGPMLRFAPNIDGHMLRRDVYTVFAEGAQSDVPLLAGWNRDEIRASIVLGKEKPTPPGFTAQTRSRFGEYADALLKAYPASNDEEALESAAALAGDLFVGYATWKWLEMHARTGRSPVYRYSFDRKIPVAAGHTVNGQPATSADIGARHAGEIEYVFGTLDSIPNVVWAPEDRTLSEQMMSYWTNFARTGDPNGPGLPAWPRYGTGESYQVMHLSEASKAAPDAGRARYEAIDAYMSHLRSAPATGRR
jgi:para-nitrobenzyl esterase